MLSRYYATDGLMGRYWATMGRYWLMLGRYWLLLSRYWLLLLTLMGHAWVMGPLLCAALNSLMGRL